MKMKYDTNTLEGKIQVMEQYREGFDRILFKKLNFIDSYRELQSPPVWNWQINDYNYPADPPRKVLKPWTFETAPKCYTLIRDKNAKQIIRAVSCWSTNSLHTMSPHFEASTYTWDYLVTNYEHSLDNGATWHPCGIEVEEQS